MQEWQWRQKGTKCKSASQHFSIPQPHLKRAQAWFVQQIAALPCSPHCRLCWALTSWCCCRTLRASPLPHHRRCFSCCVIKSANSSGAATQDPAESLCSLIPGCAPDLPLSTGHHHPSIPEPLPHPKHSAPGTWHFLVGKSHTEAGLKEYTIRRSLLWLRWHHSACPVCWQRKPRGTKLISINRRGLSIEGESREQGRKCFKVKMNGKFCAIHPIPNRTSLCQGN